MQIYTIKFDVGLEDDDHESIAAFDEKLSVQLTEVRALAALMPNVSRVRVWATRTGDFTGTTKLNIPGLDAMFDGHTDDDEEGST